MLPSQILPEPPSNCTHFTQLVYKKDWVQQDLHWVSVSRITTGLLTYRPHLGNRISWWSAFQKNLVSDINIHSRWTFIYYSWHCKENNHAETMFPFSFLKRVISHLRKSSDCNTVSYNYHLSVFVHHCCAFCTRQHHENEVFGRLKWHYYTNFNPRWVAHCNMTLRWAKKHFLLLFNLEQNHLLPVILIKLPQTPVLSVYYNTKLFLQAPHYRCGNCQA